MDSSDDNIKIGFKAMIKSNNVNDICELSIGGTYEYGSEISIRPAKGFFIHENLKEAFLHFTCNHSSTTRYYEIEYNDVPELTKHSSFGMYVLTKQMKVVREIPENEILENFCIEIWRNEEGLLHRENDKPAVVTYKPNGDIETEIWYLNGKKHRVNGPARVIDQKYDDPLFSLYYLNGCIYNPSSKKSRCTIL